MSESNKYIFLDFDGVLNTEQYQAECAISNLPKSDNYGLLFDPRAIKNLERIIKETSEKLL